jgi:hypothetical protein
MSRGRVISARAIAMRWRWPPLNSMRVLVEVGRAQADGLQRLGAARRALGGVGHADQGQRLGHRLPHTPARVQRAVRVLEDHLEARARAPQRRRGERVQVLAIEEHLAGARGSSAITSRASVLLPEPDSPTTPRLRPGAA